MFSGVGRRFGTSTRLHPSPAMREKGRGGGPLAYLIAVGGRAKSRMGGRDLAAKRQTVSGGCASRGSDGVRLDVFLTRNIFYFLLTIIYKPRIIGFTSISLSINLCLLLLSAARDLYLELGAVG